LRKTIFTCQIPLVSCQAGGSLIQLFSLLFCARSLILNTQHHQEPLGRRVTSPSTSSFNVGSILLFQRYTVLLKGLLRSSLREGMLFFPVLVYQRTLNFPPAVLLRSSLGHRLLFFSFRFPGHRYLRLPQPAPTYVSLF